MSKYYDIHVEAFERIWEAHAKHDCLDLLTKQHIVSTIVTALDSPRRLVLNDLRKYCKYLQSRCKAMHGKTDYHYNHLKLNPLNRKHIDRLS